MHSSTCLYHCALLWLLYVVSLVWFCGLVVHEQGAVGHLCVLACINPYSLPDIHQAVRRSRPLKDSSRQPQYRLPKYICSWESSSLCLSLPLFLILFFFAPSPLENRTSIGFWICKLMCEYAEVWMHVRATVSMYSRPASFTCISWFFFCGSYVSFGRCLHWKVTSGLYHSIPPQNCVCLYTRVWVGHKGALSHSHWRNALKCFSENVGKPWLPQVL